MIKTWEIIGNGPGSGDPVSESIPYGPDKKSGGHDHRSNVGDDRTRAQKASDVKRRGSRDNAPVSHLIDDYENVVGHIESQIEFLASGGRIYSVGEDPETATATWLSKLRGFRKEYLTLISSLRQAQGAQADLPNQIVAFCKRAMDEGANALEALHEAQRHFEALGRGSITTSSARDLIAIDLPDGTFISYEGDQDGWRAIAGRPSWML